MFQNLIIKDMNDVIYDKNGATTKQTILILFGVYKLGCVIVALVWIPVLYIVSR
jgi:hypothetical protein